LHQSDQSQLKLNASQTGAAVCVAGICSSLAHFVQSGADMRLLDIHRPYIPAAKTNVLETLKRMGWEPPSEDKRFQAKWETYRHAATNNEAKLK
jgi:hypothetical protein